MEDRSTVLSPGDYGGFAFTVFTLFFVSLALTAAAGETEEITPYENEYWEQLQGGPEHTGSTDSLGPLNNHTVFNNQSEEGCYHYNGPVFNGERGYIVTSCFAKSGHGNRVDAFDPITMEPLWSYSFSDHHNTPQPAALKDVVVVASSRWKTIGSPASSLQGVIVGLDPEDGGELWKVTLDDVALHGSPAADDSQVVVAVNGEYRGGGAGILALNPLTGAKVWWYETDEERPTGSPVLTENEVISAVENRLFSLSRSANKPLFPWQDPTPTVNWEQKVDGAPLNMVVYDNHILYVLKKPDREENGSTVHPRSLEIRSLKTGKLEHSIELPEDTFTMPAVKDGVAYVGNKGGKLFGFSVESGENVFRADIDEGDIRTFPLLTATAIYLGTSKERFYGMDYQGNVLWNFSLNGTPMGSTGIYHERVYVGTFKSYITVFETGKTEEENGGGSVPFPPLLSVAWAFFFTWWVKGKKRKGNLRSSVRS